MDSLQIYPKLCVGSQVLKFFIVGAGGTGSYLIRDLARIVSISNEKYNRRDTITIIDGDSVEPKNLSRQNFVKRDIGKNKAMVLAKRYSASFGIDIAYIPEYITKDNVHEIIPDDGGMRVILGCVDNNKTRHILHNYYRGVSIFNTIYIDSGNEEHGGQVVFSSNTAMQFTMASIRSSSLRINDIVEEFSIDANDRHPNELSCAENAESAPQNIATNILAANIIFGYCNLIISSSVKLYPTPEVRSEIEEYMREKNIPSMLYAIEQMIMATSAITNHVSFFNSKTGTVSSKPFAESALIKS